MKVVAVGERLDRPYRVRVGLDREHEARAHGLLVELHGARAADAVLAADVRPREPLGADPVGEERARLDLALVEAAVELDHDASHAAARSRARRVISTPSTRR